jgi:hypothetical protein
MNSERAAYTATLLPSGKVLVVGGTNTGSNALFTAELYDPAADTWTYTGSLNKDDGRFAHTATLLPSGKVLVVGGVGANGITVLSDAELYDPAAGTWSETSSLNTERFLHTATLLPSGKVLVAGGVDEDGEALHSAELYDPARGTWTDTGGMVTRREYHTMTLLPSGEVLVAGGYDGSVTLSSAQLYDQGLGFDSDWQPLLNTVFPPNLHSGGALTASGSGFQGISEASGGNGAQNSSSNYPLVQLLSLANEQTLFLLADATTGWSDTSFTSTPITLMTTTSSGFPIGYALVTVFTNGIPSQSQFVVGVTPTPTPTPTATFTPTPTPTATATFTPTPTATATFTPTPTPTATATATATFTPTPTATATFTPTPTPTATATATATFTPTPTATARFTPTPTPTATATATATSTPSPTPTATPRPPPTPRPTPTPRPR